MSRRPRIPGTHGRRPSDLYLEVATGGRPVERLVAVFAELVPRGALVDVAVHHDDECPCLDDRPMLACTCEVVGVRLRLLDGPEAA
jgi:hypothetical protein